MLPLPPHPSTHLPPSAPSGTSLRYSLLGGSIGPILEHDCFTQPPLTLPSAPSTHFPPPGTSLRYRPGLIVGGSLLEHDCCTSRSIGYYLEPLAILGLFGKKVRTQGAWLEGIGVSCLPSSAWYLG